MRDELARIPAGTYHGSFEIDGDGVDPDREFHVKVAVTLDGHGGVEIDFEGTSRQARGMINSSFSQTLSGVVYAVRCFVDPTIAMNEGCFRPLRDASAAGDAREPGAARGVRRARHDRRGGGRGDPRGVVGRPTRARGRRELADPRVHAHRPRRRGPAVAEPVLRVRRPRRARRRRRARRDRRVLPRRPFRDPPARAARGAVPVRRAFDPVVARLRRPGQRPAAASASRRSSSCSPTPR